MAETPHNGQRKPSWRDGGSGGKGSGEVRSWRKPASAEAISETARPVRWRRVQGIAASLGLVLCLAAAVWLWWILRRTPTELYLVALEEPTSLAVPVHPFVSEDAAALAALGQLDSFRVHRAEGVFDFQSEFAKSSGGVLVVYLSLPLVHGPEGMLFFAPDSRPDQPETCWDPGLLWDALRQQPADQPKLVVLDVGRGLSGWRLGVFDHHFAAELERVVAEIPNLVVLGACSAGERNWARDGFGGGRSVFGGYLVEALAGAADRPEHRGNNDTRVSVRELYEYVRVQTRQWVVQNRDAEGQHPFLIPPPEAIAGTKLDFRIAEVSRRGISLPSASADETAVRRLESELYDLQRQRDQCRSTRPYAPYDLAPLQWRVLTAQLQRAEEWLRFRRTDRAEQWLQKARGTLDAVRLRDPYRGVRDRPYLMAALVAREDAAAREWRPPIAAEGCRFGQPVSAEPKDAAVARLIPEAHLQSTLATFFTANWPEARNEEFIREAVALRRQGEAAAYCSADALPWTASDVLAGDQSRREAEDRLCLGSGPDPLAAGPDQPSNDDRIRQKRAAAAASYHRASQIARDLFVTRRVLNRLLAELPDLAAWAANRAPYGAASRKTQQRILAFCREHLPADEPAGAGADPWQFPSMADPGSIAEFEASLSGLHKTEFRIVLACLDGQALSQVLSAWEDGGDHPAAAADAQRFREQALRLEERLEALHSDLLLEAARLRDLPVPQPQFSHWREVDGILQYPLLPAEIRRELNETLRRYSVELETGYDRPGAEAGAPLAPESGGSGDRLWQAFWAVRILRLAGIESEPLRRAHRIWQDAWDAVPAPGGSGRSEQQRLGEAIRAAAAMGQQLVRQRARSTSASAAVQEIGRRLSQADLLSRVQHPYDAQILSGEVDPAAELRDVRLAELCLFAAERSLEDFWRGWYESVAEDCLQGARQLGAKQPALDSKCRRLSENVNRRREHAQIRLSPHTAQLRFGERSAREAPLMAVGSEVPPGIAAVWLPQHPPVLESSRGGVASGGGSVTLQVRRLHSPEGDCLPLKFTPQLWFRGHTWSERHVPLEIDPCRRPGRVVDYQAPPPEGAIVVEGADRRSILFVLDCSGSMDALLDGGRTRFSVAQETLRGAIADLRRRFDPAKPYQVGLIAYGHRMRWKENKPDRNPKWTDPIPADVLANPYLDYQLLVDVKPLDVDHFAEMEQATGRLNFFGNTPLIGSIREACREFKRLGSNGTVVAITDGEYQDTLYDRDILDKLKSDLKEMRGGGTPVDLHIVGFAVPPKERGVLEKLARDHDGAFHDAPGAAALVAALQSAISPRPYRVRQVRPAERPAGLEPLGRPLSLPLGDYEVDFPDARPFPFRIAGGERLVFELKSSRLEHTKVERDPPFRREPAPAHPQPGPAAPDQPTHLGYRRFRLRGDGAAEFLVSLVNRLPDGAFRPEAIAARPAEIDIAVHPQGESPPKRRSCSVRLDPQRSLPTWSIVVQDWPGAEPAAVQAVWKAAPTRPDLLLDRFLRADGATIRLRADHDLTVTAQHHADRGRAVVTLQSPGMDSLDPPAAEDLAGLRIELGRVIGGRFLPRDLSFTSQLTEEGTLAVELVLPDDLRLDEYWLGITSRSAREDGAFRAVLEGIPPDDIGM